MEGCFSPSSWVLFFSVLLLGLFVTRLNYVQTSKGDGHLIWNSNLGKEILGDGNLSPCCGFRRCHLVLVPAKLKRRQFLSTRLRYYHNSDASFQLKRLLLCGDIESNPGPANDEVNSLYLSSNSSNSTCGNLAFPFNAKGLRCCHLNVRSLPPHFDEVTTLIRFNKLDIFALSETWLNSTWNNHELNIDDYYLFRQDRECQPQPQRIMGAMLRFIPSLTFYAKELHLIPTFAWNTFVYKLNSTRLVLNYYSWLFTGLQIPLLIFATASAKAH